MKIEIQGVLRHMTVARIIESTKKADHILKIPRLGEFCDY